VRTATIDGFEYVILASLARTFEPCHRRQIPVLLVEWDKVDCGEWREATILPQDPDFVLSDTELERQLMNLDPIELVKACIAGGVGERVERVSKNVHA